MSACCFAAGSYSNAGATSTMIRSWPCSFTCTTSKVAIHPPHRHRKLGPSDGTPRCHVVATTPRNQPSRDGTPRVHMERPNGPEPPGTPRQSMQVRVVPRLASKRAGKVRIPLGSLEQARADTDFSFAKTPHRVFAPSFSIVLRLVAMTEPSRDNSV